MGSPIEFVIAIAMLGSAKEISPSKFSKKSIAKSTAPGSIVICWVPKKPFMWPNWRLVISKVISNASELSIFTIFPEPTSVAATAIGKRLWFWLGSCVKSRIVPLRFMEPDVVAPAAIVMVVSTSTPFWSDPGKFKFNSRFSARVETNS